MDRREGSIHVMHECHQLNVSSLTLSSRMMAPALPPDTCTNSMQGDLECHQPIKVVFVMRARLHDDMMASS